MAVTLWDIYQVLILGEAGRVGHSPPLDPRPRCFVENLRERAQRTWGDVMWGDVMCWSIPCSSLSHRLRLRHACATPAPRAAWVAPMCGNGVSLCVTTLSLARAQGRGGGSIWRRSPSAHHVRRAREAHRLRVAAADGHRRNLTRPLPLHDVHRRELRARRVGRAARRSAARQLIARRANRRQTPRAQTLRA